MKRKTLYDAVLLSAALVLPLSSCVKDELFNTQHPDKGAVLVTADFSERSKNCTPPAQYRILVGTQECIAPSEQAYRLPSLFAPGTYTVSAWNDCEGISVSGEKLIVNGTAPGEIESLPGYLFCARQEILVSRDDTLKVKLPMVQRTRDLHFEFTLSEGDPQLIESVTGRLEGIAGEFDLASQSVTGEAAATRLTFTLNGRILSTDIRVLGILGTSQMMTLEVSFHGSGETQTTTVDMKGPLSKIHESTLIGVEIDGELAVPVGADISAAITGWTDIEKDPADAV